MGVVQFLLQDKRINPAAANNNPIRYKYASCYLSRRYASKEGRTEVVRLLLQDKRVNPGADDNFGNVLVFYVFKC